MVKKAIKKKIKLEECSYPGCPETKVMGIGLPVGEITESGQVTYPKEGKDSSVQASCALCAYHIIFAQKGIMSLINQEGMIRIFGPFPIVQVVEAVLEAKEFHKQMSKKDGKTTKSKKKKMS